MAIQFDVPFNETLLHLTGVNNVIRFYSDNTTLATIKAEIRLNDGITPITKVIFPGPSGKFYYNFSEIINILINKTNFIDDIDYQNPINNWTSKIYKVDTINISVIFEDDSFEEVNLQTSWIAAFLQHWNYRHNYYATILKSGAWLLKHKGYLETPFIKFWQGYPFTIGFYTGAFDGTSLVTGELVGGGPFQYFYGLPTVTRLVISDGAANNMIFYHNLATYKLNLSNGTGFKFTLQRIIPDCLNKDNVYIKWLNSFGDYDYWLFSKSDNVRNTKSLGELANDFENFKGTTSPTLQIGTTGVDTIMVFESFSEKDMITIQELFISSKIYLFRGVPGEPSTFEDWIEVKLKPGSREIKNRRFKTTQLKLEFEMPDLLTRRL